MSYVDDILLDENQEVGVNYPNQIKKKPQKIAPEKVKHLPDFQDEDFEFHYLDEDAPY